MVVFWLWCINSTVTRVIALNVNFCTQLRSDCRAAPKSLSAFCSAAWTLQRSFRGAAAGADGSPAHSVFGTAPLRFSWICNLTFNVVTTSNAAACLLLFIAEFRHVIVENVFDNIMCLQSADSEAGLLFYEFTISLWVYYLKQNNVL